VRFIPTSGAHQSRYNFYDFMRLKRLGNMHIVTSLKSPHSVYRSGESRHRNGRNLGVQKATSPMSATGIIKTLTYAPRGEIDGAVLDNGTIVHVPPPVGMQYAGLFRVGAPLAASGYGTANTFGRSLEATAIGPSASQMQTVTAADYGPRSSREARPSPASTAASAVYLLPPVILPMNTDEARTRAPSRSSMLGLDALTFLMADVRDGVGPYLSVFLKGGLHWQSAEIGIAMAASSITVAICQIPAGLLVDSVRAKRLLVAISGLPRSRRLPK
jgi:hypothetical protein